ncbi:MAG TPA: Bax inhibitor-1/YccA family protein [Candidatus Nanopelagicaceae bacterium]|nr:Bax inhibitor-1/YccA family protein [Candidatus Nanopelagicaceae bacterium]
MESSNPVLTKAFTSKKGFAAFEKTYAGPSATPLETGRMTIDDVVTKTAALLVTLVVTAALAWKMNLPNGVLMIALFAGLGLAMVNSFAKTIRPPLVFAYAICEGLVVGVISHIYDTYYNGIVSQAVIGTLCAFGGILFLYSSGKLRATPKFTKMLMSAAIGYLVLGLVSLIASFAHVGNGMGLYGVHGLGLLLSVGGVALASFFFVLDFDQIEKGIKAGVPARESWRASFGLVVTLVWLYLEILRLLSILRQSN